MTRGQPIQRANLVSVISLLGTISGNDDDDDMMGQTGPHPRTEYETDSRRSSVAAYAIQPHVVQHCALFTNMMMRIQRG